MAIAVLLDMVRVLRAGITIAYGVGGLVTNVSRIGTLPQLASAAEWTVSIRHHELLTVRFGARIKLFTPFFVRRNDMEGKMNQMLDDEAGVRHGTFRNWKMTISPNDLHSRLAQSAFAFRGYNVTNLGRTPELLAHRIYGPVVEAYLGEASDLCADVVGRRVDLVARVREGRETRGLCDYAEDIAFIVAVEMSQIRLLQEHFDIALARARLAFGYSLGECAALIATDVFKMADLLRVPLAMAEDCAELAERVTLGIVSSRGPVLDFDLVRRLCLEISQEGKGVIDVSTYLSPNSLLLMGQNGTLSAFQTRLRAVFPRDVALRMHRHRYPPLHTPIMWQRNIPNRTALLLQTTPGGFRAPSVPVLSMVTGAPSYLQFNSRELMHRWVDHPQRLWDVVYRVLAEHIETVVHVGPSPNLLPATFERLSNNILAQANGSSLASIGRRTMSRLVRRPWLTRLLPSSAVLLRAPFVRQIILEDWLLEKQ